MLLAISTGPPISRSSSRHAARHQHGATHLAFRFSTSLRAHTPNTTAPVDRMPSPLSNPAPTPHRSTAHLPPRQLPTTLDSVKATTAARHLSNAIRGGTLRYTSHALEMIELADLALPFVNRDLAFAASGDSVPDRNHRGRFVAHGRALVFVYEVVSPNVVIVTAFRKE